MTTRPKIAISLGDPAGVGPEVTALALADEGLRTICIPVVYGNREVWARACAAMQVPHVLAEVDRASSARGPSLVHCHDTRLADVPFGKPTAEGSAAQAHYLLSATQALASGEADGLCTAPVSKASVASVMEFEGHTEYLQQYFRVPRVTMLMAGDRLRVALATNHLAIEDVARRLDTTDIVETGKLVAHELIARFGVVTPRLAVLALNPHAGDGGKFGEQETRMIAPAIAKLREEGVNADGPFPADGFFPRVLDSGYDAVIAMYHNQGLIPFKMLELHTGVNVTLGLPKPRTSPDHGTGYDIAGTGVADHRSMLAALRLCVRLVRGEHKAAHHAELF